MPQPSVRRSEQAGLARFSREMASALAMALIFIVYVIQAFKIPTGSMENSLLVGDFLLGLKFIYGAPVLPYSYHKLPAVTSPKPGDVIIFKYPGADKKDYIKRCVAGPGQTLEIHSERLVVNGKDFVLPPKGKYSQHGMLDPQITDFEPLRIPAKGDVIDVSACKIREFIFLRNLVHQENPKRAVRMESKLFIDGMLSNSEPLPIRHPNFSMGQSICFNDLAKLSSDDWLTYAKNFSAIESYFPGRSVEIKNQLYLDNQQITRYTVQYDNYFMMGDNRDNSADSRYWGYLNRNFVKAKAFILYFSLDSDVPWWQFPLKIRWNRIGKLIRSWDGINVTPAMGKMNL